MKQRTFHFVSPVPVHSMHDPLRIFYATTKVNDNLTKLFVPYATSITGKRRSFLLISCAILETDLSTSPRLNPYFIPQRYPINYRFVSSFGQRKRPAPRCGPRTNRKVSRAGSSSTDAEFRCKARPRSPQGQEPRPTPALQVHQRESCGQPDQSRSGRTMHQARCTQARR